MSATRAIHHSRQPWILVLAALLVLAFGAPLRAELPWRSFQLSWPPLATPLNVGSAELAPNGKVAVYSVTDGSRIVSLHCVRLDGLSDPVDLTSSFPPAYVRRLLGFSPDSRWALLDLYVPSGAGFAQELWSVPICAAGAQPRRLSPAGPSAPDSLTSMVQVTGDSRRVVFVSDNLIRRQIRLYSAPIEGAWVGPTVELEVVEAEEARFPSYSLTSDLSRLVTSRRNPQSQLVEIVSMPISGPASAATVLVTGSVAQSTSFPQFRFEMRVAQRAVYVWRDAGGQRVLYSLGVSGSPAAPVPLSPPHTFEGEIDDFVLAPDGRRLVYSDSLANPAASELYSIPVEGPLTARVRLNPDLAAGSRGYRGGEIVFTPDARRVLFSAEVATPSREDLFSAPVEGPAAATVRLNTGASASGLYRAWLPTADSRWVLFLGEELDPTTSSVHFRAVEGSGDVLDLRCDGVRWVAMDGADGAYVNCRPPGIPTRQLVHVRPAAAPPGIEWHDVSSLDDLGVEFVAFPAGPTAARGVLTSHEASTPGVLELWAIDRRLLLHGLETGDLSGWSAVAP